MKNRKERKEKLKEFANGVILTLTTIALIIMAIVGAMYAETHDKEQGIIFCISAVILLAGVIIFSFYHGHDQNTK